MYVASGTRVSYVLLMIGSSYEWQQDVNDYGIVEYSSIASGEVEKTGTPTPISPAFYNLLRLAPHVTPNRMKT